MVVEERVIRMAQTVAHSARVGSHIGVMVEKRATTQIMVLLVTVLPVLAAQAVLQIFSGPVELDSQES
jgi:hypothetical protein